jgi:hypothetical protein
LDLKLRKILLILEKEFKLAKKGNSSFAINPNFLDEEMNDIKEKIKKYKFKKSQVEKKIKKLRESI